MYVIHEIEPVWKHRKQNSFFGNYALACFKAGWVLLHAPSQQILAGYGKNIQRYAAGCPEKDRGPELYGTHSCINCERTK